MGVFIVVEDGLVSFLEGEVGRRLVLGRFRVTFRNVREFRVYVFSSRVLKNLVVILSI